MMQTWAIRVREEYNKGETNSNRGLDLSEGIFLNKIRKILKEKECKDIQMKEKTTLYRCKSMLMIMTALLKSLKSLRI
jgi:hypothetical protein